MRTNKELFDMLDVVTEAMYGGASQEPDWIDFSWWSSDQLHELINNPERTQDMNEDDFEALVMEVAKRVGAKIENSEGSSSAD